MELAQYTSSTARAEAQSIAAAIPPATAPRTRGATPPTAAPDAREVTVDTRVLRQHEVTLQGGFAVVYREGHSVTSYQMPQRTGAAPQVRAWLPEPSNDEDEPSTPRAPAADAHVAGDFDATLLSAAGRTDLP